MNFPFVNFTASFNNLFDKLLAVNALFETVEALSHLPTFVSHIQVLFFNHHSRLFILSDIKFVRER